MFERTHHRRIAQVLTLLDGDVLRKQQCWFGGGTACALLHREYRESVDVDFLVSDVGCYRALRQLLTGPRGVLELMPPEQELVVQIKAVRADQHGIRTSVSVDETPVKFEVVLEGASNWSRRRAIGGCAGSRAFLPGISSRPNSSPTAIAGPTTASSSATSSTWR